METVVENRKSLSPPCFRAVENSMDSFWQGAKSMAFFRFPHHFSTYCTGHAWLILPAAMVSTFFITFCPFPHPWFSTVSTHAASPKVIHISRKTIHTFPTCGKTKVTPPKACPCLAFHAFPCFRHALLSLLLSIVFSDLSKSGKPKGLGKEPVDFPQTALFGFRTYRNHEDFSMVLRKRKDMFLSDKSNKASKKGS